MKRIAGELHGNSGNARKCIILHCGDGSADGTCLRACLLGSSVLRKRGGNREQEDKGNTRSRKPNPCAAPIIIAGERAVSRLEKQGWDWINIPAHAKTWKTFLSVCSGELLSLADNPLLAIPDDSIPICCLRYSHGRPARSTKFAAAKSLDWQSIVRTPQGRTENWLRLSLQLYVTRMTEHARINGNRRLSGNCQRESQCVS